MPEYTQKSPYRWRPGQSGNPKGKPKGTVSILTHIKAYLAEHPEKIDELVQYYLNNKKLRDLLIKMIDGSPRQQVEANLRTTVVNIDEDVARKYNIISDAPSSSTEESSD